MTEYDYSPEAYERYIENQNRVSNWVTDQTSRVRQYSNPFVQRSISTPPPDYPYEPHPPARQSVTSSRHSHSPLRSTHDYRREPQRSHTAYDGSYRPSRSSHTSPLREYAAPSSAPYTASGLLPGATYRTYDASAKDIVLPAPRKGETYVIIPPKGRRVEVVTDSNMTVQSASSGGYRNPAKKSPPLLKRIFTNLGPPSKDSGYYSNRGSNKDRSRSY